MFSRKDKPTAEEITDAAEGQAPVEAPEFGAAGGPPPIPDDLDAAAIDQMSDEEVQQLAGQMQQVAIPILTIPLEGVRINVVPNPEGGKVMIVGPVALTFTMPLNDEGAKIITRGLTGGVEIAREIPKMGLVTP